MNEDREERPAEPPTSEAAGITPPTVPARRGSRTVIGPFTVRHLVALNTVIAVAVGVLFVVTRPLGAAGASPALGAQATFYRIGPGTQGLDVGQLAPEISGAAAGQPGKLTDLDGRPVSLADLRGHPVWIVFWATWCPPCQTETPSLEAAYQTHAAQGLVLLAVDVQEPPEVSREYARTYGLSYPILPDIGADVFATYRVFGLPTHYFIDRDGVVRDRWFGPLTPLQMEQRLAPILTPP